MRASQFIAYINADPEQIKVHRRSRVSTVGVVKEKLKAARRNYNRNIN